MQLIHIVPNPMCVFVFVCTVCMQYIACVYSVHRERESVLSDTIVESMVLLERNSAGV